MGRPLVLISQWDLFHFLALSTAAGADGYAKVQPRGRADGQSIFQHHLYIRQSQAQPLALSFIYQLFKTYAGNGAAMYSSPADLNEKTEFTGFIPGEEV